MFSSQKVRRTSFDVQITLLLDGERERESWEITLCFDAGNLFTTQALFLDLLFMCVFDRKMWGSGSVIAAALMFHSCIRWPFSIVYKHVVSLQIVHSRPNIRIAYCIYFFVKGKIHFYGKLWHLTVQLDFRSVTYWLLLFSILMSTIRFSISKYGGH